MTPTLKQKIEKKNRHQRTEQQGSSPEQLRTDVFSYEAAQSPLLYSKHISKRDTEGRSYRLKVLVGVLCRRTNFNRGQHEKEGGKAEYCIAFSNYDCF